MKVLHFPLAKVSLCFMAGIICCHFLHCEPWRVLLALAFLLVLLVSVHFLTVSYPKTKWFFGFLVGVFSFTSGMGALSIHDVRFDQNHYIHHIKKSDEKHLLTVTLRERLKSSAQYSRYVAIVKNIDDRPATGKILLHFDKTQSPGYFSIGAKLRISGKIALPKPPANPDQFDYGKYLANKSILAQMHPYEPVAINHHFDKDAFFYADALRNRILRNLQKAHFNPTQLAVIAALVLGQQQDISAEILHDYQLAGAIHILSVSGLHVGFILLFLNFVLDRLPKTRATAVLKLCIIWFALWGFAVLAGLSPSVVRSVTMFSFVALGMHLKRQTNIFHTLLVSMLLILLFEPSFLFDIGFQLSYLALFFILWLQPIFLKWYKPDNQIVEYFWQLLTVSFAAQIGTLPLSLYYFHQFPGLFFVTNLVIIPFLGVIMGLGVAVMLLAALNWVPAFLAVPLEWSIAMLNKIIGWIASVESFIFEDIPFNAAMLTSAYVLIVVWVFCLEKCNFIRLVWALAALLLFESCYFGSKWTRRAEREWIVFNARKTTLIAERTGDKVTLHCNDAAYQKKLLTPFLIANFSEIKATKPLQNAAYFKSQKILLIDSLAVYPKDVCPDVVVLRQSPKINLDRLLDYCKPKVIVADASNFKSYVKRWERTCNQQKIPFHATAEKGFYRLK
ncbi:MAG TPA: ComEC/Rec2 family competence protein [Flavobacterium sp.]|nr:ComEC/Rec2 family competence protein [Flavobacterium sp.]